MDTTKSTGILINKIKLMDKIECEIESAKEYKEMFKEEGDIKNAILFEGKAISLQDLEAWIEGELND